MEPAIDVQHLVKDFRLSHSNYRSFKGEMLAKLIPFRSREISTVSTRRVLDDISFRIEPGEGLGLVGRNGSGKSTLLGLIARIYRPTSGQVRVNGRLVGLLELGAGFNPELTGAQNLLFNGVLLGLTRQEVIKRFDSIVEFAELREFINAPLRNYSSGMQMRLGFSLAIHADADILLVDEALAVGDQAFRQKCYSRIAELKRAGKTIILVSHIAQDIQRVADRVLWLKNGKVVLDGGVQPVMTEFIRDFQASVEAAGKGIPQASAVKAAGAGSQSGSSAELVEQDKLTGGNWKGRYGAEGYQICQDPTGPRWPSYATVTLSAVDEYEWPQEGLKSTLERPDGNGRCNSTWYARSHVSVAISLTDTQPHQVALYCLDPDGSRIQAATVKDMFDGSVIDAQTVSDFTGGEYLVWTIRGSVVITLTRTIGANAVLAGIFFDPA